jgi:hypothetical protein
MMSSRSGTRALERLVVWTIFALAACQPGWADRGQSRDTSMKSHLSSLGFYSPPVLVRSLPV